MNPVPVIYLVKDFQLRENEKEGTKRKGGGGKKERKTRTNNAISFIAFTFTRIFFESIHASFRKESVLREIGEKVKGRGSWKSCGESFFLSKKISKLIVLFTNIPTHLGENIGSSVA